MENDFNPHVCLRVLLDSSDQPYIDVPVKPYTICSDILVYCKQRGKHNSHLAELWRGCERRVGPDEKIYDLLKQWGPHCGEVAFYLRPNSAATMPVQRTEGRRQSRGARNNGLREEGAEEYLLSNGVDLTLAELQEMAARQQRQINEQQYVMVAKEQRLKYLRQHEGRLDEMASEGDRLHKLREKVEAQESKLKKLRALRFQVTEQKGTNSNLSVELESIRYLFNEKEKELSVAVSRVDDLARQLDDLRQGRIQPDPQQANVVIELNKLRKELVIRSKLNEQQNSKLAAHRNVLQQRTKEMAVMDQRIAELQHRLRAKKQAQQANRNHSNNVRNSPGSAISSVPNSSPNVATVEPYRGTEEGSLSKKDPKYQSLPYNVKFPVPNSKDGGRMRPGQVSTERGSDKSDLSPRKTKIRQQGEASPTSRPTTEVSSEGSPSILYATGDSPGNPATSTPVVGVTSVANTPVLQHSTSPVSTKHPSTMATQHKEIFITDAPAAKVSDRTFTKESLSAGTPSSVSPSGSHHERQGSSEYRDSPQIDQNQTGLTRQVASDSSLQSSGKPYRYASVNVIADTYTGKLAPDHYRKNVSRIYKDWSPSDVPSDNKPHAGSDLDNSNQVNGVSSPSKSDIQETPETSPSPGKAAGMDSLDGSGLISGVQNIDPERNRLHFNKQQPRPLRRRHSSGSGDSPEGPNRGKLSSDSFEKYRKGVVKTSPEKGKSPQQEESVAKEADRSSDAEKVVGASSPVKCPDVVHIKHSDTETENSELNESSSSVTAAPLLEGNKIPFADDDSDVIVVATRSKPVVLRRRKGNLKSGDYVRSSRRVSFDPLALLLDAALEGELDLVVKSAHEVADPSRPNDEGITALHNAICAGHSDIVKFLVEYGCDVNSPDSDGWTPLHCAASCNNLGMVRTLVEHGACIFAQTISDHETAAEKCEEDEEGYHGCSQYLYGIQEKLGIANKGVVYAVFDYEGESGDELSVENGDSVRVIRKGDDKEREWWWAERRGKQGYVPRNLLGMFSRVVPKWLTDDDGKDQD